MPRILLLLLPLLIVGCHTAPVATAPTSDGDGYGDPYTLDPYGVDHAGVKGPVGDGEGFGPLERRLVALKARSEAMSEARDTQARRASLVEGDLSRAREHLSSVEAENKRLREQLSERDRLLATYIQRLRVAESGSRGLRRASQTHGIDRATSSRLDAAVTSLRVQLRQAQSENARLRAALAERDRRLARLSTRPTAPRTTYRERTYQPSTRRLATRDGERQPRSQPQRQPQRQPEPQPRVEPTPPERPLTTTEAASTGDAPVTTADAGVAPAQPGQYHLRLIALSFTTANAQHLDRLAVWLQARGVSQPIRRRKVGRHWVLDIGDFASKRSPEAIALRDGIRQMRYQGRREFSTAYFTRY